MKSSLQSNISTSHRLQSNQQAHSLRKCVLIRVGVSSSGRAMAKVVFVFCALLFLPPLSADFSSFIFSLLSVVKVLATFLIWSLGKSLASCLVNSCRNRA